MKKFYYLLIEDNLNIEDLSEMHHENRRDIKEMKNEFRNSKSFAVSYTITVIFKIFFAGLFVTSLLYEGLGTIYECDVNKGICDLLNYKRCWMDGVSCLSDD
jgi:hypothetical protein